MHVILTKFSILIKICLKLVDIDIHVNVHLFYYYIDVFKINHLKLNT